MAPLTAPHRAYDRAFVDAHAPRLRRLLHRYFRAEVRGLAAMPDAPCVAVGNHSGATLIPDTLVFLAAHHTSARATPLSTLAHDQMFSAYPRALSTALAKLGAIPARADHAAAALADGHAVLVYPGGDYDACRSFSRRDEIVFAGRTGYVAVAKRAGVPIVPVVSHGGHRALVVLSDGAWLARALRLHARARLTVCPVTLSLPWGLFVGPLPGYLPLPTKIVTSVLPAVDYDRDEDDRAIDARVRAAMQAELTELRDEDGGRR